MANEHDKRSIWALPEPGDRRPRYTRDQIAAAALRIADSEGFDAVTMKRIAAELGAGTMTLYYYVRNKTDIVALMHDAIMADALVPAGELTGGWRAAITAVASQTRRALLAHHWSLGSLDDAQFGPNAMRHLEQSLAAVSGTGLPPAERLEIIVIVDDYVFGNVRRSVESLARARAAEADPEMVAAMVSYGVGQLKSGEFPELADFYAEAAEQAGPPMTPEALASQFERGLRALLDGLAARLGAAL